MIIKGSRMGINGPEDVEVDLETDPTTWTEDQARIALNEVTREMSAMDVLHAMSSSSDPKHGPLMRCYNRLQELGIV